MRTTRRAAVGVPGLAVLALVGCSGEEPQPGPGATRPTGSTGPTVSGSEAADPDRAALDRAVALSTALLARIEAGKPVLDPSGELTAVHRAHLAALGAATGDDAPLPRPLGPVLTPPQLRTRELVLQRRLAGLALEADSGPLARLLASMSAGIAAALSHRGEMPR